MKKLMVIALATLFGINMSYAAQVTADVYTTEGNKSLGQIVFADTPYGLLISPHLTGLPAGPHGFHLHQHPSCGDAGMDAGDHFDRNHTNTHLGPYGEGHLGDLPVLYVTADGQANTPTLAPRLKTSDVKNLTVMVHAGGDNYSDTPKLGGGGARVACGVIQ